MTDSQVLDIANFTLTLRAGFETYMPASKGLMMDLQDASFKTFDDGFTRRQLQKLSMMDLQDASFRRFEAGFETYMPASEGLKPDSQVLDASSGRFDDGFTASEGLKPDSQVLDASSGRFDDGFTRRQLQKLSMTNLQVLDASFRRFEAGFTSFRRQLQEV